MSALHGRVQGVCGTDVAASAVTAPCEPVSKRRMFRYGRCPVCMYVCIYILVM